MIWNEVLDRLELAGLAPVEESYLENYGQVLSAHHEKYRSRTFRCTHGIVQCCGIGIEIFIFPSDNQGEEFLETVDDTSSWRTARNVLLHFPECSANTIDRITQAVSN